MKGKACVCARPTAVNLVPCLQSHRSDACLAEGNEDRLEHSGSVDSATESVLVYWMKMWTVPRVCCVDRRLRVAL